MKTGARSEKTEIPKPSKLGKKFYTKIAILFVFEFLMKFINFNIKTQIRLAEDSEKHVDYNEEALEPIKIWVFLLAILAIIVAGVVDNFNLILFGTLVGLGMLFFAVCVIGYVIAPFTYPIYNFKAEELNLTNYFLYFNVIFEPIRSVFVLQHFALPGNQPWLLLGIGVLMICRNLAMALDAITTAFMDESAWIPFIFDAIFLLPIICFGVLFFAMRNSFASTKRLPLIKITKREINAAKSRIKNKIKCKGYDKTKEKDHVKFYSQETREVAKSTVSIIRMLLPFIIYSAMTQIIYDAYNYQVEINVSINWIANLYAEQIISAMNIINISLCMSLSVWRKKMEIIATDLRKIILSFVFTLLVGIMLIYAQTLMDKYEVILPEARSAKLRIYNAMNSSVIASSRWTGRMEIPPYGNQAFFVRGWDIVNTMMTVTNQEGFEMRNKKYMTEGNIRKSYTKTIFSQELATTSYVLSNLGLVKIVGSDRVETCCLDSVSAGRARLIILSTMTWRSSNPATVNITGESDTHSLIIPTADKKHLLSLKAGSYQYTIGSDAPNKTFVVKPLSSYALVFYEGLNNSTIEAIEFTAAKPKLRRFSASLLHFLAFYVASWAESIEQVWLTRFLFVESPLPSKCFLFASMSFVKILGANIYYLGLFMWKSSTLLIILIFVSVVYTLNFALYIFLVKNLEQKNTKAGNASIPKNNPKIK